MGDSNKKLLKQNGATSQTKICKYGIYSLGRHATWRKILLDDVVGDIERIQSMMKTSAYDRMLGKTR